MKKRTAIFPGMKINQLKAGVVLTYAQMFLNGLISLAYTPIMLRLLGQSEYGVYTMASSVISYLGLLKFGLSGAYVRFYTRYQVENNRTGLSQLNGLFLAVYGILACIALASGLTISANIHVLYGSSLSTEELRTARILMAILSLNLAFTLIGTVFTSYITANEKFLFQKLINVGKTVISPMATIPILLMGGRSVGMVVITTVVHLIVDAANIIFCRKKLGMRFSVRGADFRLLKEIASYSVFIAIHSFVDQINWQVDKIILGHYHGAGETAVYGVASQLNTLYIGASAAISNVLVPRIHRLSYAPDRDEQFNRLFVKVGRIQMLVLSLVGSGLVIFGKTFLRFWAGEAYTGAYGIMLLLVLPGTIALIQNVGIEMERARNLHRFRSCTFLAMALVNLCVSIPLGRSFGGLGCAAGTAFSLIFANGLVMNWFYGSAMGLKIGRFWGEICKMLPGIFLAVVLGVILTGQMDSSSLPGMGAGILIYVGIYGGIAWAVVMNSDEKRLVKRIAGKMLHR